MKTKSKSGLFLIELIIVILFFSLASTVCIQLFVKAHLLGKQTEELNRGVSISQNLAESFYGFEGDVDAMLDYYEASLYSMDDDYYIKYNSDFEEIAPDSQTYAYYACMEFHEENSMQYMTITISKTSDHSIIYSLNVNKYKGGAVS